jgi:hypothetical protein
MLNSIVSVPAFAFASRIACRSEPAPLSAVVVTVNVAAGRAGASKRTCSESARAAEGEGRVRRTRVLDPARPPA